MRLWKTLVSNQTKCLFVFLLAFLLPICAACGPASSTPQTITSTATAQPSETPSPTPSTTPSITPSATPTITPSATPTIALTVEAPQFWIENQELFEQNGYSLVASASGWEIQYKEHTVFTDKEAENKSFTPVLADAGPTMVFTQVDEEGAVEKFYNPQVNPDFGEAEWENYLDISVDKMAPTEVTVGQVHSGQVLMSALIKNGTEQWWEDDEEINSFALVSYSQHEGTEGEVEVKFSQIALTIVDEYGASGATSPSRFLGFYQTNFASEKIVVGMQQTLVSGDGESVTLNAGYSGPILTEMWDDYTTYLQRISFRSAGDGWFRLYGAVNDQLFMKRLLLEDYVGVRMLYEQDPDNQPCKLFPDIVEDLKQMDVVSKPMYEYIKLEPVRLDIATLRKLQFMVLYPGNIH
jgi:hypothetical protein